MLVPGLVIIFLWKREVVYLLFLYCGYLCCMSLPQGSVGRLQTVIVALPSLN